MAMVLYQGANAINKIPRAVQAAMLAASTIKQALSMVKQTKYYASQAIQGKRAIEAEVRAMFSSSNNVQQAPVAIGKQLKLAAPRFRAGNMNGVVVVSHREYLGEISGSTTFNAVSYPINPGLGSSFPWLGGIANSYEKYRIRSMQFEFINVAATSERGRITLAVDYDVLDLVPTNKVDLFQIAGASEGPIWEPLKLSVKSSPLLFTRNGNLTDVDLKTYDAGRFIAAVSNAADTTIKGELFVSYEIELHIPQPAKCPGSFVQGTIASWSGLTPFAGTVVTGPLSGFSITSDAYLTFARPGVYIITNYVSGTGSVGALTVTTSGATEVTYGTNNGGTSNYVSVLTTTVPGATLRAQYGSTLSNASVRTFVAPFNNYAQ